VTDTSGWAPRVTEGLFIAGATLAGYAVAFAYEAGFAGHFGVPLDLVSLDLTKVILAVAALLGLGWFLFLVFNPVSILLGAAEWPAPIRERIHNAFTAAVTIAALLYIYGPLKGLVGGAVLFALGVVFFDYVFPLITQRKTRGYFAKLTAQSELENKQVSVSPIVRSAIGAVGPLGFLLLGCIALVSGAAFSLGQAKAEKCEWFYCCSDTTNTVLLRAYGSSLVGVRFDPTTRRLTGQLVLGTRGEGQWQTLAWKRVGPLAALPRDSRLDKRQRQP
jgi:hypothetical protein